MSTSENTNPRTTSNEPATKDDSTVPYKVSGEQELRGLSTSVDKSSPGLQNASGTSEQRRGEDITFTQDPGEKSYVGTKTATESLIDTIEKGV